MLGYGQRQETDLHSKAFRPNLKPNLPPVQWHQRTLFPGMILTIHSDKDSVPILTKIIFGLDIIMINEYIIFNCQGATINENYLDVKCTVKDPRTLRSWVGIVK